MPHSKTRSDAEDGGVGASRGNTGGTPVPLSAPVAPASPAELRAAWEALKAAQPRLYPREGAALLGVSEAQIVALGCGRGAAFRLASANAVALLNEMRGRFGALLFIVRNDDAVLEKTAALEFEAGEAHGRAVASARGDGACLAFVPSAVAMAFAVRAEKFIRRGVLFFDAAGTAVLKAYLQGDDAQVAAFDEWVAPLLAADQTDAVAVSPVSPAPCAAHSNVNVAHSNAADADAPACPHAGCSVKDAAAAAPVPLAPDAFKTLLQAAAKSGEPVTLGLHNAAAIFSVRAPSVTRVAPAGPWFNVLDEALHTHLRESAVAAASARADAADGTLRLSCAGATGKPLFWLRIPAAGAAANAVLERAVGK